MTKVTAIMVVLGCLVVVSACPASHARAEVTAFQVTDFPTGLAWDGQHLWLADRDCEWLYALDPASGLAVDSVACPSFSPAGLAFGEGSLWVSGYREEVIYKLDLERREVVDVIDAPSTLTLGLAWHDDHLWACDASARRIFSIDPADGTPSRSFKAPSRYPHGLASDGRYLWVSDRVADKIYMVEPERGWVVLALDSPGFYPRGLAWGGGRLWNVDYQADSLYALNTSAEEDSGFEDPKKARVCFTFKIRCLGPDPVDSCHVYLAVPHSDLAHQTILEAPNFKPQPQGFLRDRWDQEFAHFILTDIGPGQTEKVSYETAVQISKHKIMVIPERVGSLSRIPLEIRRLYTADGARLLIHDPVIEDALKQAVGSEENPYWMMRRIFEYVNDHIEYERVGGWDTAPNVLKRGTGSCSEYSFVFMAMARAAGIPTRFSAGVCERGDLASMDDVYHRWTEVYLPGYGWVPVDASAGDQEWQADRVGAIGSYTNRILITTVGGGDSEYLGWGYNCGYTYSYSGRSSVSVSVYADWEPLE